MIQTKIYTNMIIIQNIKIKIYKIPKKEKIEKKGHN